MTMKGVSTLCFIGHYHINPSVQQFGLLVKTLLKIFKKPIENRNKYFCSNNRKTHFEALEIAMTFCAEKIESGNYNRSSAPVEPNLLYKID